MWIIHVMESLSASSNPSLLLKTITTDWLCLTLERQRLEQLKWKLNSCLDNQFKSMQETKQQISMRMMKLVKDVVISTSTLFNGQLTVQALMQLKDIINLERRLWLEMTLVHTMRVLFGFGHIWSTKITKRKQRQRSDHQRWEHQLTILSRQHRDSTTANSYHHLELLNGSILILYMIMMVSNHSLNFKFLMTKSSLLKIQCLTSYKSDMLYNKFCMFYQNLNIQSNLFMY